MNEQIVDESAYAEFGAVARERCHEQCQYPAHYLFRDERYPHLGEGLRTLGNLTKHDFSKLHIDDVETFVTRYEEHQRRVRSGQYPAENPQAFEPRTSVTTP
jgi:hypothetical protein